MILSSILASIPMGCHVKYKLFENYYDNYIENYILIMGNNINNFFVDSTPCSEHKLRNFIPPLLNNRM